MDAAPVAERGTTWQIRDWIAAFVLFFATAAVVLWQNSRLTVMWDLSYVLDTAARIASGQMPYRDFPLAHAPLTFLIQAAVMRIFGRVFFHHALYAACVGGLGTVVAWQIVLGVLRRTVESAWTVSVMLAAPLTVLGVYSILPNPSYDCDCAFSLLIAILLLQRLADAPKPSRGQEFAAGAATVVPIFFKQNIGLPFFLAACGGVALLVSIRWIRRESVSALAAVLCGALTALATSAAVLHFTFGVGIYYHWTVQFAAQRRLPGLGPMLEVYREPSLLWTLPCIAVGVFLAVGRYAEQRWASQLAFSLFSVPFAATLLGLFLTDSADDRASRLLALWPLLLIVAAVLAVYELRRGPELSVLLPFVALGAINGTLLSQQLWGSTYAIWPLLAVLVAGLIGFVSGPGFRRFMLPLAAVIATTLLVCGGLYMASEERLSYADVMGGNAVHATLPQLAGMTVHGSYLPDFQELVRFAVVEIPAQDGLILLPGEDPFYFATGRVPQFPVLLFDPATDPYTPEQTAEEARKRGIRWLIVKRKLQIAEDPMPNRNATVELLMRDFVTYRRLRGYDVYRRR